MMWPYYLLPPPFDPAYLMYMYMWWITVPMYYMFAYMTVLESYRMMFDMMRKFLETLKTTS